MGVPREYLPATGSARHDLVLLHGWGGNREIWRPLLIHLRPRANITLLDIPGLAAGESAGDLDAVLDAILAGCPRRAVYVGWSLGGQLAMELARRREDRVAALVTVCSNPRFIASGEWPGMCAETFGAFRAAFDADPAATVRRFHTLQATGSGDARRRVQQLRCLQHGGAPRPGVHPDQAVGLDWLATLDQRAALETLPQPRLHLLAANDALVPPDLGEALAAAGRHTATVSVLEHASHLAPLDAPAEIAAELHRFLAANGAPQYPPAPPSALAPPLAPMLDKAAIATSFSRAAARYDSAAHLQREVGEQLLTQLDGWRGRPARVLDLGCGTGYFRDALRARFPQAQYIGLDLAPGMVSHARTTRGRDGQCDDNTAWLVGDAEALPLASGSVDLVFSSLAVQWCYRPGHLFAELVRVLAPGGRCVFTSMGPDTLRELRAAWASVDGYPHVNTFVPPAALHAAADAVPGAQLALEQRVFTTAYARVRDLLDELKALGAHNVNRNRPGGLAGRRALQGMLAAYESLRRGGALPATWEVLFGTLEKT